MLNHVVIVVINCIKWRYSMKKLFSLSFFMIHSVCFCSEIERTTIEDSVKTAIIYCRKGQSRSVVKVINNTITSFVALYKQQRDALKRSEISRFGTVSKQTQQCFEALDRAEVSVEWYILQGVPGSSPSDAKQEFEQLEQEYNAQEEATKAAETATTNGGRCTVQ